MTMTVSCDCVVAYNWIRLTHRASGSHWMHTHLNVAASREQGNLSSWRATWDGDLWCAKGLCGDGGSPPKCMHEHKGPSRQWGSCQGAKVMWHPNEESTYSVLPDSQEYAEYPHWWCKDALTRLHKHGSSLDWSFSGILVPWFKSS